MVKLWHSILAATALVSFVHGASAPAPAAPAAPKAPAPKAPAPRAPAPRAPVPAPKVPVGKAPVPKKPANGTTGAKGKGTNPLVIKGYRFFDSVTGEYFGMKGVNYYPRPNTGALDENNLDLFSDKFKHIWQRDLPHFHALSANAIRLYAVDPDENHHEFMCALQSLGIYVLIDLGHQCKGCEITPDAAPDCYPASYKTRGEKIIAQFAQYDNVIGFSGGNEINHRTGGNPPEWNAPCQKKFVRDMRAFIQSCPTMRQIPVGLVVADTHRDDNALYYNCRTDPKDELENAEWYGINVYVHCDDIDDPTKAAGFNLLRDSFKEYQYSIPTILTEFGCTAKSFPTIDGFEAQRTFHDAKWMNDKQYSEYFGGGFAFEYSTENANSKSTSEYPFKKFGPQNYGLGYLTPEDCDDVENKCDFVRFPNFEYLAKAYNETDTSDEPTLTSFKIDPERTKPSKCPKHFAKLSDHAWASDKQKSIACPTVSRYQCPNVPINLDVKVKKAKDEVDTSAASTEQEEEASSGEEEEATEEEEEEGDDDTPEKAEEDTSAATAKTNGTATKDTKSKSSNASPTHGVALSVVLASGLVSLVVSMV